MLTLFGLLYAAVTIATEVTLAPLVVSMIVGLAIPLVVGLVTKSGASAQLKQVVTILLAGIAALITSSTVADGSAVFSLETLLLTGMTWLVSIASYLGVYRPLNANDHLAPDRGLGVVDTTGVEKG